MFLTAVSCLIEQWYIYLMNTVEPLLRDTSIKEARKGFLLTGVCLNDEILKNDATDDTDHFWISIRRYY